MMVKVPHLNIFHPTWCWIAKRRCWLALECAKISGEHHSMNNFHHESLKEHIYLQLGKRKKSRIPANPAIRGSSLGWSMDHGKLKVHKQCRTAQQGLMNKFINHHPFIDPSFLEVAISPHEFPMPPKLTNHSNKMRRPLVQLAHSTNWPPKPWGCNILAVKVSSASTTFSSNAHSIKSWCRFITI